MLSAATTHSALRPRLYSTRKAVIGEPPFALGIQVTYTELSVAMEMVGRSGASGTGTERDKLWVVQTSVNQITEKKTHTQREAIRSGITAPHGMRGWNKFTETEERKEYTSEWSGMPWRNVYLLPGLLATKLERAGESERERRGLVKRLMWASACNLSKTCKHTHTHAQMWPWSCVKSQSFLLAASFISRVIAGCQLSPHKRQNRAHLNMELWRCIQHRLAVNYWRDRNIPQSTSVHRPAAAAAGQQFTDCVHIYLGHVWWRQSACWGFCPPELLGASRRQEPWRDSCWRRCSSLKERERKKKKERLGVRKQGATGFQGYRFHQKHKEQLRMLAQKSKISFPVLQAALAFIRVEVRFSLDNSWTSVWCECVSKNRAVTWHFSIITLNWFQTKD